MPIDCVIDKNPAPEVKHFLDMGGQRQLKRKSGAGRNRGESGRVIYVPVSHGELFDRLTILEIKEARILDPGKQANVRHEIGFLRDLVEGLGTCSRATALINRLRQINSKLWDLENRVRAFEKGKKFDGGFLRAARSIYALNDKRSAVKRRLNILFGSVIIEEKEHS